MMLALPPELVCCSKALLVQVGLVLLREEEEHPTDTLLRVWRTPCHRLAVQFALRERGQQPLTAASARRLYHSLKLAQEAVPAARFTFHLVTKRAACTHDKAKKVVNGEAERHQFIAFASASEYSSFFLQWKETMPYSCLMECCPIGLRRKWVIDMDAPLSELQRTGLVKGPRCTAKDLVALHAKVLRYARAVCERLCADGFTKQTPRFAVLTRHRKTRAAAQGQVAIPQHIMDCVTAEEEDCCCYEKLSWHIVLLAMAPHEQWRSAMSAMEHSRGSTLAPLCKEEGDKWQMAILSDPAVLRNSKGQYMQTLHSLKVQAGKPLDESRFVFCGLYQGATEIPLLHGQEFCVTSMALPDPYSIAAAARAAPPQKGKKPRISYPAKKGYSWECVPDFAREVLENKGVSYLLPIQQVHVPPQKVLDLVELEGGEITCAAEVVSPRLCARELHFRHRVHAHSGNNALVMCVKVAATTRVFVRCFSQKCKALGVEAWIEVDKRHRLLLPR